LLQGRKHSLIRFEAMGQSFVRLLKNPQLALSIGIITILVLVFIVYPLLSVTMTPSLGDWSKALTTSRFHQVFLNTVKVTILSTLTASLFGFIFAYSIERANVFGKRFFSFVALLPIVSPPFLGGMALIMLLGRRGFLNSILGTNFSIYGLNGIWISQTIAAFPMAFLMIRGVLSKLNTNLEYAAQDLGASRWQVFRQIVIPLAKPGILGAMLMVAIQVLADFATPMIIGGRFSVLATEAYMQIQGWADMGMGAALAILLFIPAGGLFFLQKRLLSKGSYVTVSGKGGASLDLVPLPPVVKALLFLLCSLMSIAVLSTYVVVLIGSFVRVWGVDYTFSLENFEYAITRSGVAWNSIKFALIAGGIVGLFSVFSVYVIKRGEFPGQKFLDFTILLPAAIPGTMLGLSYLIAFNSPPLILTGTATIVVAVMVFRSLPMGYRTAVSSHAQIDPSLEESATDLGAGVFRRFRTIVLPLMVPAFSSAVIYTFMRSVNTLSSVIFVTTPGSQLASVRIIELVEYGEWGRASALALIIVAVVYATLGLMKLLLRDKFTLFE